MEAQLNATIATIPYLPNKVLATSFRDLQVVSVFDRKNYEFCRWRVLMEDVDRLLEIRSSSIPCEDRSPSSEFRLECVETEGIINTTLIILFPLESDVIISTECASSVIGPYDGQANISLNVTGE